MLVLSRKLQEQIRIGNDITLTILKIKGNVVRVGIDAPRDIRITRAELPLKGEFELKLENTNEVDADRPQQQSASFRATGPLASRVQVVTAAV